LTKRPITGRTDRQTECDAICAPPPREEGRIITLIGTEKHTYYHHSYTDYNIFEIVGLIKTELNENKKNS